MSILKVEGLSKYFGGLAAVKDVGFEMQEGMIMGLIGPNGAGKTTLFTMIAGSQKPSAGTITYRDRQIQGISADRAVKLGVCRTNQVVKPFRELSVVENVMVGAFYGRNKLFGKKAAEKEARRILEFIGMENLADLPAGQLSIGNLKRLEIARALATKPDLLLLDEICGGLTPSETAKTMELMKQIRSEQGISILYIEHDMKAVMSVCDRILVLNYGQKIAEGTPQEIVTNQQVIDAYLGQSETA
ncbi:ABC transporter ATP-binding protein [Effusibacillus dendaii]|uniref:ABC transporter ATP-binding protein n=1 Tax=Effusibacillus dendaii TaxID=2743772 RepID=A0A7I8DDQ4_9BACL|nr:ABC transporter ATP-binding protein [Effusibacillus dendaii]BCJ86021.1 ABC transporter ATP-binding protein [Effusibacillus dendaii]